MNDTPTVPVEFTCNGCEMSGSVNVPERGKDEDVATWARNAAAMVGEVHRNANPSCRCPTADLKIPIPGSVEKPGRIGEARRQ